MPDIVAIIPARLGSTRLPGKVLLNATGKPLIQHVWESVRGARGVGRVVIATDAERVVEASRMFGAECIMTSPDHANGTSRLDEAAALLRLPQDALIVNVQGDEPEIEPEAIDAAAQALTAGEAGTHGAKIGTIAVPFATEEQPRNPACVKVVLGRDGSALYFSRALIPHVRDELAAADEQSRPLRHVGIYAYRRGFLAEYARLPATPLERVEQLEQLRALEHGHRIMVAIRPSARAGIDTPEQYLEFVTRHRERGA